MFGSSKPEFSSIFPDGFCHKFGDSKSGIGISKDKTQIAVAEKGTVQTYPLAKIRGHQCVLDTGSFIPGSNPGVSMAIGDAIRAAKATGLFLRVKDIEKPVWRIAIKDELKQQQWNEILQQWYDGELE